MIDEWVDVILAPYVKMAPPGIIPLLFLDSFKVHMLTSIVQKIQELGIQVEFIPPGCTGLLQPIDGGYNKASRRIFESSIITALGARSQQANPRHNSCQFFWLDYCSGKCNYVRDDHKCMAQDWILLLWSDF